jgi:hypothetical protein
VQTKGGGATDGKMQVAGTATDAGLQETVNVNVLGHGDPFRSEQEGGKRSG